jgi:hypothetical protein
VSRVDVPLGQGRTSAVHLARSALPRKQTNSRTVSACPLCATFGLLHRSNPRLFDYLVGERDKRRRQVEAQRLGCFEVENELILRGLLERQIARFFAA